MVTNNATNEGTASSGKVLQGQGVGTASAFSTATYPATTTSQNILYSSAANTVSELAPPALSSGSVESFDGTTYFQSASTRARVFDDFFSSNQITNHQSGSGSGGQSCVTVDNGHAGIFQLSTGTATGKTDNLYSGPTTSLISGGGNWYYETLINLPALSNGTNEYQLTIGIHDGWIYGGQSNGFYFSYIRTTSTSWQFACMNGGVATTTTSATAVATGWTKLAMYYNGTNVNFYINGSSQGTISTHLTTNGVTPCWLITQSAGTSPCLLNVDYIDFTIEFTTPR